MSKETASFLPDEWNHIALHFKLPSDHAETGDSKLFIPVEQLLDPSYCAAYMAELQRLDQLQSALPAASAWSKRYAAMLAQSGLYAMSMLDKGLDLSSRNCYIELQSGQDARLRAIRYSQLDYTVPHAENRERWREEILHALFANHLTPLWKIIANVARIPLAILWENTAVYIYVLYEQVIATSQPDQLQCCQDDFYYIMQAAPGDVFGLRKNPLSAYYHPPITSSTTEGTSVRKRKTCCYYYKIDSVRGYCKSCPIG